MFSPSTSSALRLSLVQMLLGCMILLGVTTLLGYLGAVWWWFDLFDHFRVQYTFALFTLSICLFTLHRPWAGLAAMVFAVPNLIAFVPSYLAPSDLERSTDKVLSVVLANVNSNNSEFARLAEYVAEKSPDIVVVLEVTAAWEVELRTRLPRYPYGLIESQTDSFGIAVLSTLPLRSSKVVYLIPGGPPSIAVEVPVGNRLVTLIGTHPVPPNSGSQATAWRDSQLAALAEFAKAGAENDLVVVGDLNTTPWSRSFRQLQAAGLQDSRLGFGIQASWPTDLWPFRIPIDHCLTGPTLIATKREVGPNIGSDHYPIYVELSVRPRGP